MRTLILTALFSLVSFQTILAKDYLLLSAQTGFASHKISDSKNVKFTSQTGVSPVFNITAMLNLKHIQAGIGLEFGNIKKPYNEYYYYDEGKGYVGGIYNGRGNRGVTAAYEMSYAMLHYKFNLPRQSYVYIGGMVGKLKGENDFVHSRFCTGTVYGINAGVALRVSNRVNITINESWRITSLQPDNEYPGYSGGLGMAYNSQPATTFLQYEPMELQQLSTTLGIGVKLF